MNTNLKIKNLKIEVCGNQNCSLTIREMLKGYLPEQITPYVDRDVYAFKFSETVSIDILTLKGLDEKDDKPVYKYKVTRRFVDEDGTKSDSWAILPVEEDGWFIANHIVIQTESWLNNCVRGQLNPAQHGAFNNKVLYIINDTNDIITSYRLTPPSGHGVMVVEKLEEMTVEEFCEKFIDNTLDDREINISYYEDQKHDVIGHNLVVYCHLERCYINLVYSLLDKTKKLGSCEKYDSAELKELIIRRDIAWMAINALKYNIENCRFYEANRILKMLSGCNGLCNDKNNSNSSHKCGCNT